MPYLPIDNETSKLKYEDSGGEGQPIVLIHGFACDQTMWDRQKEHLTSQGRRVITYDMRGFGESSTPTGSYSHHEDLHKLLSKLGIKDAHLVGFSFGGQVALDYVETYLEGNKDAKLTLIASSLDGFKPKHPEESPFSRWAELIRTGQKDTVIQEIKDHKSISDLKDKDPETYENICRMIDRYGNDVVDNEGIMERPGLWHLLNRDPRRSLDSATFEDRLRGIACPTEVIVGKNDLEENIERAEFLAETIPNAVFTEIEGNGHFFNREGSAILNSHLHEMPTLNEGQEQNRGIDTK
jgi:pimeloyl-ACP methyl ester carboxylesterase